MNETPLPTQAALARLREKAAARTPPPLWDPKKCPVLEGTVADLRDIDTPLGSQRQLVVQPFTAPPVALWAAPYLMRQLEDQRVNFGDLIRIEHLGRQKGSNGRFFERLVVTVEKP